MSMWKQLCPLKFEYYEKAHKCLAIDGMVCNSNQGSYRKMDHDIHDFCLVCCFNYCEVCEVKLYLIVLTDNSACGSGSVANSLGRVSCTPSCTILSQ